MVGGADTETNAKWVIYQGFGDAGRLWLRIQLSVAKKKTVFRLRLFVRLLRQLSDRVETWKR